MTKLFEQFSGVMSIMLILSAGHLLGILTQCVANNSFITVSQQLLLMHFKEEMVRTEKKVLFSAT